MSASPYFNKAASYGAHQTPYSSQSTFYTGQQQLTPRQSELKHISSPLLGSKYINRESQLHQVHQKYEKEAQKVNTNYVKHYQKQLEFNDNANHVQDALDMERKRCATLEARLDECFREMDQHKRQKLELARESAELREILRRKEGLLADSEQKLIHVQENANGVNFENDGFRHEMRKLSETYTAKLKEVEEKYKAEIREFNEELDSLRSQIKEQDIDTEAKVRGVSRDLEAKVRSLENQLREKDRIINETTHEIGSLKEYNVKLKMEYEEELRRQLSIVKDKERVQFEAPTKDLENRLRALEVEKDSIEKKIPELKNEIKDKEKTIKELKTRAQDQLGGLRRENIALNDQISEMGSEIERLQSELVGKDSGVAKLHTEIRNLNLEVGHQKEYYLPEIERLVAKNNEDIKRFQDYERNLKARIMELERMLKVSDAESGKLKVDIERLKVQTAGNVHKAISEIFGDYGTANLQGRPAF